MNIIAYCDVILGEEMLYMYARIRGIDDSMISAVVTYLIEALDLTQYRDKQTQTYRYRFRNTNWVCVHKRALDHGSSA